MKKQTRSIVRIVILALTVILVGVTLYFNLSNDNASVALGDSYVDFELETLDGEVMKLSEVLEDSGVILNFWGTWCKPCVEEMPDLEDMYSTRDEAFEIIAVNVSESPQQINQFIRGLDGSISFPIVLDRSRDVSRAYSVGPMPTTIAINQEGVIVKKQEYQLSTQDINEFIDVATE